MKTGIALLLFVLGIAGITYGHYSVTRTMEQLPETVGSVTNATTSLLYSMATSDRDAVLYQMIGTKDYATVIKATDEGIQNFKNLVWDDVEFWDMRATAYFRLGDCVEAAAAAYHASVRDQTDELFGIISNSQNCYKILHESKPNTAK